MRRAVLAATITAALCLLAAHAPLAAGESAVGEWVTAGDKARVRIEPCAAEPRRLCGLITWAARPADAPEGPLLDRHNNDPALRSRPILGLPLLAGFGPDGPDRWSGGTIYDPEGGKTYTSKLRVLAPDQLQVSGCVLVFCRSEVWRRYRP